MKKPVAVGQKGMRKSIIIPVNKFSEEMGVRYMQAWEEKMENREEGFEDGARDKACQTAYNLYDRGFSAEDTSRIVEESLEIVRQWYQEWAGK